MLKYAKHFVLQSYILILASLLFGLALAVTNAAWSPRIEQNRKEKLEILMKGLITQAETFEELPEQVELDSGRGKTIEVAVYKAVSQDGRCLGWAFNARGSGFADKIELVVAADEKFTTLAGFNVLSSNETPGFGDKIKQPYYRSQFAGAPAAEYELSKTGDSRKIDAEIVAISGATVSSQAVVDILNNYIGQIKKTLQDRGLI
ncbi:MAG: FMN-binding protein [Planctomycetota bacterium]